MPRTEGFRFPLPCLTYGLVVNDFVQFHSNALEVIQQIAKEISEGKRGDIVPTEIIQIQIDRLDTPVSVPPEPERENTRIEDYVRAFHEGCCGMATGTIDDLVCSECGKSVAIHIVTAADFVPTSMCTSDCYKNQQCKDSTHA